MFRLYRIRATIVVLAAWFAAVGTSAAAESPLPRAGEFAGQWNVNGELWALPFMDGRRVAASRVRGEIDLTRSSGFTRSFRTSCIGFSDAEDTGAGRCEWVDADEDRLYIETQRDVIRARDVVRGAIVGGTGKYAGISGEFELEAWLYTAANEEEGEVQAYTDSLRGSWTFD